MHNFCQKRVLRVRSEGLNYRDTLGCSQVVRQLFLVQCTVGSNPTIPAKKFCMPSDVNRNLPRETWNFCRV